MLGSDRVWPTGSELEQELFGYTKTVQTWTVPSGVTQIIVEIAAGSGGRSNGGAGAVVHSTLDVEPDEVLDVYVGGGGAGPGAGWPNGGDGGTSSLQGGGGGGASWLVNEGGSIVDALVVAGGGGGGTNGQGDGGDGGTPNGADGTGIVPGVGATQEAAGWEGGERGFGGKGGGSGGQGGASGGGGGGGWYGGGGGPKPRPGGGGGGGSSMSTGSDTTYDTHGNADGYILIEYEPSS